MGVTYSTIADVPANITESQVVLYLATPSLGNKQVKLFKQLTNSTDKTISEWFGVSEKTFQGYKRSSANLGMGFKEKLLLLLSLYKLGERVFGSIELFNNWLEKPNFHFNNKQPHSFFTTISGIRYLEARLMGIEYGDNA